MSFAINFKDLFKQKAAQKKEEIGSKQPEQKSIYTQMQDWGKAHEKLAIQFDTKLSALEKQTTDKTTPKEARKLQKELEDLLKEYEKEEEKAGSTFDFMEGTYNTSDAKTFIPAYQQQTAKLANGDIQAWDTNKDGKVDANEYEQGQMQVDGKKIEDENVKKYAQKTYEAMDLNDDGNLDTNEIQGFYAALDNADGSVDGKISADSLGVDFTSDKFKRNISEFQDYLK